MTCSTRRWHAALARPACTTLHCPCLPAQHCTANALPCHLHEGAGPKADVGAAQPRPRLLLATQQPPLGAQDGVGAGGLEVGPQRVQQARRPLGGPVPVLLAARALPHSFCLLLDQLPQAGSQRFKPRASWGALCCACRRGVPHQRQLHRAPCGTTACPPAAATRTAAAVAAAAMKTWSCLRCTAHGCESRAAAHHSCLHVAQLPCAAGLVIGQHATVGHRHLQQAHCSIDCGVVHAAAGREGESSLGWPGIALELSATRAAFHRLPGPVHNDAPCSHA